MTEENKTNCPLRAQHCGGCPLLNMPYPAQLACKQKLVESYFPGALPILGMKSPYHYRNKVISTFAPGKHGLISGLYAQGSHYVLPVESCLLQDARSDEIVSTVRGIVNRCRLRAYDEDRHTGVLRHLLVRRAQKTGQVLVTFVTASPLFPNAIKVVRDLTQYCTDVTTVIHNINPRLDSAVLGYEERVLYGPGYIEDILCGCAFRLSSRAFYQVNSIQTERLYDTAVGMAEISKKDTVVDAYCGIGTIGIIAAARAGQVIGIEFNADAVRDAVFNARRNGLQNIDFIRGDAGQLLRGLSKKADVVFLDPPRAGCDFTFLSSLCAHAPRKIVYISCNIETQARDVRFLEERHYAVRSVRSVDMFPHTEHVECVVELIRK